MILSRTYGNVNDGHAKGSYVPERRICCDVPTYLCFTIVSSLPIDHHSHGFIVSLIVIIIRFDGSPLSWGLK
eukprot:15355743-Ditylum_brightwellii.AAC.1